LNLMFAVQHPTLGAVEHMGNSAVSQWQQCTVRSLGPKYSTCGWADNLTATTFMGACATKGRRCYKFFFSPTSNIMDIVALIAIISLFGKHSLRLSSSTAITPGGLVTSKGCIVCLAGIGNQIHSKTASLHNSNPQAVHQALQRYGELSRQYSLTASARADSSVPSLIG